MSVGTVTESKSIVDERKKTAPLYFMAGETPKEVPQNLRSPPYTNTKDENCKVNYS